jgi:multidrug resistance efflux pump
MIVMPAFLAFLPWQQNINAPGRVIAYDPELRLQTIEAPQDGRIQRIYAKENDRVTAGQLLVSIQDPDPNLIANEKDNLNYLKNRLAAGVERVKQLTQELESQKAVMRDALAAADQQIEVVKQSLLSAEQSVMAAKENRTLADIAFRMEKRLLTDGLTSEIQFQNAKTTYATRQARELESIAARDSAKAAVSAAIARRSEIKSTNEARLSNITANINSAQADLETTRGAIKTQEIRLARLNTLEVHAPRDGVIHRVLANAGAGGTFVKQGDVLMVFIPDIPEDSKRIVEVYVDGNDAPQLTELWRQRLKQSNNAKIKARVQFEGYPVIQIIGWPNLAVGTFGGLVMSVDPHDDGKGKFRVLIEPDPEERPWPSDFAVRQGARVQSWLLLDRVSIGFELWRRFNAFPPVMAEAEDEKKEKPAKVRLPK